MAHLPQTLPLGFRWAAVKAGIKASGRPDLAIAVCTTPATAAAMFTRNQVVAAPVTVGREALAESGGRVRALLVNAGNANCATGASGIDAATRCCAAMAEALGCTVCEVFPSSTGIIGVPLPAGKLIAALPDALAALDSTPAAAEAFSSAILTTDTRMKVAQQECAVGGATVRVFGCCKGAGMIGPQLGTPHATMLVYLFTDLGCEPAALQGLLHSAVDESFNNISVDGDTSTNDTVLLLSSGASGLTWESLSGAEQQQLRTALERLCQDLAYSIVDDGEGVTHVVTLRVTGTTSDDAARQIAKSVANSPLCKTAWSSADPNWGRLLMAAGKAGVPFQAAEVSIHIGGVPVFEKGTRSPSMSEAEVHQRMLARQYEISLEMGSGPGRCTFVTCDLTVEYVHINADYST